MRVFRFLVLAIAAAGGVLLAPAVASAHGMNATVEVRPDSVYLLADFDDGLPAEFATVSVTDASGNEILTGKTDERGQWTFAKPAPGQYKLTAKCIGHVATVEFPVEGVPDSPAATYTSWRLEKSVGISVGLALLLGLSLVSWLILRRRGG